MEAGNKWIRGSLKLVILRLLYHNGSRYGYEIRRAVADAGKGYFHVTEAALYTTLHQMADDGWVGVRSRIVEGRRRHYYRLNAKGRKMADRELKAFDEGVAALRRIFRYKIN